MTRTLLLLSLSLGGCAAPEMAGYFNTLAVDAGVDGLSAAEELAGVIDAAQTEVAVALPALEEEVLTDAIVAAWDRGVDVRVVSDIDRSADPGILALQEAGVPLQLGCDEVSYHDYAIDSTVSWPAESVRMSHAFAVADQREVAVASEAGSLTEGDRVVFSLSSVDLAQDLLGEFTQVYGGTDASSLTAFSSLAKSMTDARWHYPTQSDVILSTFFGPQERLVKRVTDAVYGAKASVWILTGDLADEGLARALQAKAARGFDVKVVVGGGFGRSAPAISDTFATQTPDVLKYVVPELELVPTIVLVDYALDRNGDRRMGRGMVLSHDLLSASRLYYSTTIPTDQLIDGTMMVLEDPNGPSDPLLQLLDVVQSHRDLAEEL